MRTITVVGLDGTLLTFGIAWHSEVSDSHACSKFGTRYTSHCVILATLAYTIFIVNSSWREYLASLQLQTRFGLLFVSSCWET
jgi:hypothetical protein